MPKSAWSVQRLW